MDSRIVSLEDGDLLADPHNILNANYLLATECTWSEYIQLGHYFE
jgi:hypothetical protein